jgi:uncharacterized protein YhbP (UPF0306 family)
MFGLFEDKTIIDFLKGHSKAVIATVDSQDQPSTSAIFYIVDKSNSIFFVTKSQTTKSENLKLNSKAALTILDDSMPITLSLIGVAVEIIDQKDRDDVMQEVFKLSYSELHDYAPIIKLHKGSFSVMKFIPTQGKLTDYTKPMGQAKENLKNF